MTIRELRAERDRLAAIVAKLPPDVWHPASEQPAVGQFAWVQEVGARHATFALYTDRQRWEAWGDWEADGNVTAWFPTAGPRLIDTLPPLPPQPEATDATR